MQMQVHKMIRSRLETCWENIHTLGRARNISDLADSFTWASMDMALQLHSCGTSHWQNHNHHAYIARRWRTLFHNVSGYERPSTAKALTTQHQGNMMSIQHLGIQSILLLREVYRVNSFVCETSQGLFNKYMRSSDGLLCWFSWHNYMWQWNWHIFSARTWI